MATFSLSELVWYSDELYFKLDNGCMFSWEAKHLKKCNYDEAVHSKNSFNKTHTSKELQAVLIYDNTISNMMRIRRMLALSFIAAMVPNMHGEYVESDYANYYDEIAQATCTAMNTAGGWTYAVRRPCPSIRTCLTICQDPNLRKQDGQVANRGISCVNSLHVYHNRPRFTHGAVGNERLGLKTYNYNSCGAAGCGPNYCCCKA
ncbi:unnamed protein product [Owenia fusiformis]|uniref:Uncharacterized protein n=1 Tax=Owenia fusiformis TaxID=6347 RepID=A0A8J1V0C6_OWEFU|nr:unnamed protein product [Owenia fusiformis]